MQDINPEETGFIMVRPSSRRSVERWQSAGLQANTNNSTARDVIRKRHSVKKLRIPSTMLEKDEESGNRSPNVWGLSKAMILRRNAVTAGDQEVTSGVSIAAQWWDYYKKGVRSVRRLARTC